VKTSERRSSLDAYRGEADELAIQTVAGTS